MTRLVKVTAYVDCIVDKRRRSIEANTEGSLGPVKFLQCLKVAIELDDVDLCQNMLECDVNLNAKFRIGNGCAPLFYALRLGRVSIAERLAAKGASPDGSLCSCPFFRGDSAFHIAASYNLSKLFEILLQHHPLQYVDLKQPVHPLHRAISKESLACAEIMVNHATCGICLLDLTSR